MPTVQEFTSILEEEPFSIYEKMPMPKETIDSILDSLTDNTNFIDSGAFVEEVSKMKEYYAIRSRTFLKLRKHLETRGTVIEHAIALIKNSAVETLKEKKSST